MFQLVYGQDLADFPELADQMFKDRRVQFRDGLGWPLSVDAAGREVDEYDACNPLYIIAHDASARHIGSTRLLPTTGRTMIADHFSELTHGVEIESPLIWECTRFFVTDQCADARKSAAGLMWAGCQFGLRSGVQFYVGVTAAHMVRVFGACGWRAEIIGSRMEPEGEICACLWELSDDLCSELADRAGMNDRQSELRIYRRASSGNRRRQAAA